MSKRKTTKTPIFFEPVDEHFDAEALAGGIAGYVIELVRQARAYQGLPPLPSGNDAPAKVRRKPRARKRTA